MSKLYFELDILSAAFLSYRCGWKNIINLGCEQILTGYIMSENNEVTKYQFLPNR